MFLELWGEWVRQYLQTKGNLMFPLDPSSPLIKKFEKSRVFRKLPQPQVSPAAPHPGQALLGATVLFLKLLSKSLIS